MEQTREGRRLTPASKNFVGVVVMTWVLLAILHLLGLPQQGDATEIKGIKSAPSRNWAPDDGSSRTSGNMAANVTSGGTMPADMVAIPLVAARDDRSPGIRVDAMPFGPPDLSTIWGLSCNGSLVPLFLDAHSGDLFALATPETVWPDGMLCKAYAAKNRQYWVQFDLKNVRFVVQGTPEYKPI